MWARGERLCVSPGSYQQMLETNQLIDVRAILGQIRTPTLVMQRSEDRAVVVENGRYISRAIPGARYIEYPGTAHFPQHGDWPSVADDIEEFVTGTRVAAIEIDRVLATVLFTDIVDSTRQLAQLGDAKWRVKLDGYESGAKKAVDLHRGRFVKSTGDGLLATFDGPARAIRCAIELRRIAGQLGLATRAGVHTGEIELRGEDVGGLAVHVAARIMSEAQAAAIAVSRVVTDLVAGSGLEFAAPRVAALKGLPGEWQIHDVAGLPAMGAS
jgi:class 3 adenylate cyclase